MIQSVSNAKETLQLATNNSTMETTEQALLNQRAGIPTANKVWFDEDAMTNVFSLANMVKRYRVTFDSSKENAFVVHTNEGPVRFSVTKDNLYALDMADSGVKTKQTLTADSHVQFSFIQSRRDNETFYTRRQLQRASTARNLLHALGNSSIRDLKAVLRIDTIKNCPVTIHDIDIMERVYGPDVATCPKLHV